MSANNQPLEQHYAELGPMLLVYFRRRHADGTLAEDLLQETFMRALRDPARYRAALSARAYLFGIARHVSLDAVRRRRPAESLIEEHAADTAASPDPRLDTMREAIAALPDTHREPLLLKLQQELSYEEIAHVLGLPVGTVRSRLHYAVARLQQVLNPPRASRCQPVPTKP